VLVRGGAKDAALERGIQDILISISHCRTYATAYALAIAQGDGLGDDDDFEGFGAE
jgi:holo-[acyl-carrier protein] synthase